MKKFSKFLQVFVERIQSTFDKKKQGLHPNEPLVAVGKGYNLVGYFTQIGTHGVGSDPSLGHGEEISIIVRNKPCNGKVLCIDLIFA